jgi:hypothetical protein
VLVEPSHQLGDEIGPIRRAGRAGGDLIRRRWRNWWLDGWWWLE